MPPVSEAAQRFILHWGELARSWGISKTMGQIHALLYITGGEWSAEDIMETLNVSRGNVSMTLRELLNWRLAYRVHHPGERKEFYTAEQNVWEIFHRVLAERKRREIDPTHTAIDECLKLAPHGGDAESAKALVERLEQLREFFTVMDGLYQKFTPHSKADVDEISRELP